MLTEALTIPECVSFDRYELPDRACPNCSSRGLSVFYSVKGTPVHSCLLMSSRRQALDYPKGDINLGFCRQCGFVTNVSFNPLDHEYSALYEETQGFSNCFNSFARSLAGRVIDKYDIHHKKILEIGCGKGDFLAMMCRLGDNVGVGVDPAYVPDRNPADDLSQVEFICDFYGPQHADIKADVICCRHTLEHIAPTFDFMDTIRKTIGDRKDTLVFFEVPDVMCVLDQSRFWDIYYEHCTYYTAGSIARLFRSVGFDIDELYLDYDGQYIILNAFPTDSSKPAALEIENDMERLLQSIESFHSRSAPGISYWGDMIRKATSGHERVVLWGSGSKAVAFLNTLGIDHEIEYVVDINPYRHGKYIPGTGQRIVLPEFLEEYHPDKVIVMNPVYCKEIAEKMKELNIKAELLSV